MSTLIAAFLATTLTAFAAADTPPTARPGPDASGESGRPAAIPMDQIGAVAGKQYQGDALRITATTNGARLRCGFHKLQGRLGPDGSPHSMQKALYV